MLESQSKPENKDLHLPSFTDDDDADLDEQYVSARKRTRRRRWIIGISIVLLIILLVPTAFFVLRGLRPARVTYLYSQVTQGNLSLVVSATGPVQATLYDADFLVNGRVTEIDVKVGQQVKAGQVLAKIDATALQDALNQANASLQQQKDFGTQDAIDIAQKQVDTAQHNLDNATLKAPHAGAVTAINGVVGGTSTGGGASAGGGGNGGGFIQIVDASALHIQANVNESDIGGVSVGQKVQFTVSAYGSRTFDGTISAISPLGQNAANVVTYPVTVDVDMKSIGGAHVLPGMTANVTITLATRSNVLLIPVDAVNFAQSSTVVTDSNRDAALAQAQQMLTSLQSSDATISKDNPTAAYVLERVNGKWVVKPVVLGLSNGTSYEVLAGLTQGETIAVGQVGGSAAPSGTPGGGPGGPGGPGA